MFAYKVGHFKSIIDNYILKCQTSQLKSIYNNNIIVKKNQSFYFVKLI